MSLGRLPDERILTPYRPRLLPDQTSLLHTLGDVCGVISDALDLLGLPAGLGHIDLAPRVAVAAQVGVALTVKNVARSDSVADTVKARDNRMAEIEAHALALPGDMLVIQGSELASNLGGLSMQMSARAGVLGAVVDGAVRDVGAVPGYGVWSRTVTPVTGKWRVQTEAINVPVQLAGRWVYPGDVVAADSCGVCVIPRAHFAEVLSLCQQIAQREAARRHAILTGVSFARLAAS